MESNTHFIRRGCDIVTVDEPGVCVCQVNSIRDGSANPKFNENVAFVLTALNEYWDKHNGDEYDGSEA